MADDPQIRFRPLETRDLELMHRWLNDDFVARWWPGWPSLEQVHAKYAPRIEGTEPTKCYIIEKQDQSIGFIQCYRDVAAAPHFAPLFEEPGRVAGIDLFLGNREFAYRGLGPRIIRRFLSKIVFVLPETNLCMIDPAQNNLAAIRAYTKAGFHHIGTVQAPGELQPSYLMILRREELRDE